MTVVSIAQSAYLPWSGAFERIAKSDLHIVLDHVHLSGGEARNKIRTPQGFQELIVPIKSGQSTTPITNVVISEDGKWQRKHWLTIKNNYARAPFFKKHFDFFEGAYTDGDFANFSSTCGHFRDYICAAFGIKTPIYYSSKMEGRGQKSDLNLNLCKEVDATVYLSGPFGREYLDIKKFKDHGIEVRFHDYKTPEYKQAWPGFVPNMSVIDALFCLGRLP